MTINAFICYFMIQMITSFYTLTRLINRGCRNPCQIDKGWLRILWHTDSHPCIQLSFNTNPNNEFSTCTCIYHNIHLYKINCKQRYTWWLKTCPHLFQVQPHLVADVCQAFDGVDKAQQFPHTTGHIADAATTNRSTFSCNVCSRQLFWRNILHFIADILLSWIRNLNFFQVENVIMSSLKYSRKRKMRPRPFKTRGANAVRTHVLIHCWQLSWRCWTDTGTTCDRRVGTNSEILQAHTA